MQPEIPFYQETGQEIAVFEHAFKSRLPLMLKGPTGCGKSRFVEHMAARLNRPLITVACNEDTSATDLIGRYIIKGGETIWQDGPISRAMREGAILYLDEVVEARPDILVVIHPLTDFRRKLYMDRHNEELSAPDEFLLVVSFNPGYQNALKELKPSTRQRFLGMSFDYPSKDLEAKIVIQESKVADKMAAKLVKLGEQLRSAHDLGLSDSPSTRLLVDAGILIKAGLPARQACDVAIVQPLSDDLDINETMNDMVSLLF